MLIRLVNNLIYLTRHTLFSLKYNRRGYDLPGKVARGLWPVHGGSWLPISARLRWRVMEDVSCSQSDSPRAKTTGTAPRATSASSGADLIADRRAKLRVLRQEVGIDPFGQRVDGLSALADARARYDEEADRLAKEDPDNDRRPVVKVAGRVMLRRVMGGLAFMTLRDATGDLQIAISKKSVGKALFDLAKLTDLGDLVVARGPIGTTKTGEVTVWATGTDHDEQAFGIVTKSLALAPEKWHGLQDPELRYRKRYVDLYANPDVMRTFAKRSQMISRIRQFLTQPPEGLGPGYVEVETPMMQPIAGGAAARPFVTHHNALGIWTYTCVSRPELVPQATAGRAGCRGCLRSTATSATRGYRRGTTPSSRCSSCTRRLAITAR